MARSMTITQEDSATTSPLFVGFFLLAVAFLLFGSVLSYSDAQPPQQELATQPAR